MVTFPIAIIISPLDDTTFRTSWNGFTGLLCRETRSPDQPSLDRFGIYYYLSFISPNYITAHRRSSTISDLMRPAVGRAEPLVSANDVTYCSHSSPNPGGIRLFSARLKIAAAIMKCICAVCRLALLFEITSLQFSLSSWIQSCGYLLEGVYEIICFCSDCIELQRVAYLKISYTFIQLTYKF